MFLTVFPLFIAKRESLPCDLSDLLPSLFTKERLERFALFHEYRYFSFLNPLKLSNSNSKQDTEFMGESKRADKISHK